MNMQTLCIDALKEKFHNWVENNNRDIDLSETFEFDLGVEYHVVEVRHILHYIENQASDNIVRNSVPVIVNTKTSNRDIYAKLCEVGKVMAKNNYQ